MTQVSGTPAGAGGTLPGFSLKPSEERPAETPSKDDQTMGMLCYLLGLVGILGPLVIWLVKKETSKFADVCGKEMVNFEISMLIYVVALGTLVLASHGFLCILWPVLGIGHLVLVILGTMKASTGVIYRMPFCIRFIK